MSAMPSPSISDARTPPVVHHRTVSLGSTDLFYREAGPPDGPVVLLLHGFPTSSHMFRNLIPVLADRYRVIAPDYPGYGQSPSPSREGFKYTFDRCAEIVAELLSKLNVKRYAVYVMDYGAPVAWRLALQSPKSISGLIIQNGNAYDEGLKQFWVPIKAYWNDPTEANRNALRVLLSLETTKFRYLDGVRDPTRVSPDNWVHDQALLDRPGNDEIQLDMFYDYRTNLALYPKIQDYFRTHQPPSLLVWGQNDYIFPADGAHPYKRDLKNLEFHLLDTGHFVLEDRFDEVAPLIHDFLDREVAPH